MNKYELSTESITVNGTVLYRVRALRDFARIKSGEIGGYIESEVNHPDLKDGACP